MQGYYCLYIFTIEYFDSRFSFYLSCKSLILIQLNGEVGVYWINVYKSEFKSRLPCCFGNDTFLFFCWILNEAMILIRSRRNGLFYLRIKLLFFKLKIIIIIKRNGLGSFRIFRLQFYYEVPKILFNGLDLSYHQHLCFKKILTLSIFLSI